jgi:6,7-dimethyl-8-ribityllumazine synthase
MNAEGTRAAILVARFNHDITQRLLDGARQCLDEHGCSPDAVDVLWVPGAWELPQAAAWVVARGVHDVVVTLGCVIRGDTPHFDYVCDEATRGLGAVARSSRVPVVFGALTTDDHAQALARAGEGVDNKGYEVTLAALEMAALRAAVEEL